MANSVVKVKSFSGKEVTVSYAYSAKMEEKKVWADGYYITTGKQVDEREELYFEFDGKKVRAYETKMYDWDTSKAAKKCREFGVDTYFDVDGGSFIFEHDQLNILKSMIKEIKAAGTDPEVTEFMNAEAKKKAEKELAEARKVLEQAKKTYRNPDGSLMTTKESFAWRRRYNDINNDGGDGFVPDVITVEAVKEACKVTGESFEEYMYREDHKSVQQDEIVYEEVEMAYKKYKGEFKYCDTKKDSYDSEAKTIVVKVPIKKRVVLKHVNGTIKEIGAEKIIENKRKYILTINRARHNFSKEEWEVIEVTDGAPLMSYVKTVMPYDLYKCWRGILDQGELVEYDENTNIAEIMFPDYFFNTPIMKEMEKMIKERETAKEAGAELVPRITKKEIEVSYKDYKNKYSRFEKVDGTYDAKKKTIKIMVPEDFEIEEEQEEVKWKSVEVNTQNIETETATAYLINCPRKSDYAGYSYWVPAKLVKAGSHSYALKISFTDEFEFKLKKYGKGKWNKSDVIDEVTISANDFLEMYGGEPEEPEYDKTRDPKASYTEIEEPVKIDIDSVHVEVPECLQN